MNNNCLNLLRTTLVLTFLSYCSPKVSQTEIMTELDRINNFKNRVRKYLIEKVKSKELDIEERFVSNLLVNAFPDDNGELIYSIDSTIIDAMSQEIKDQVDAYWSLD